MTPINHSYDFLSGNPLLAHSQTLGHSHQQENAFPPKKEGNTIWFGSPNLGPIKFIPKKVGSPGVQSSVLDAEDQIRQEHEGRQKWLRAVGCGFGLSRGILGGLRLGQLLVEAHLPNQSNLGSNADHLPNLLGFRPSIGTVDGRNPFCTTLKVLFVVVYRGIIIPGFLRWCRILSIHSMIWILRHLGWYSLVAVFAGGSCGRVLEREPKGIILNLPYRHSFSASAQCTGANKEWGWS